MNLDLSSHPHRRFNALTGDHVLVSPHRTKRPWQGKVDTPPPDQRPAYVPDCYLCPRNERAGGFRNPDYRDVFVFQNDFSAMLTDTPVQEFELAPLMRGRTENGLCRVICFSPRHDLTLPEMDAASIRRVVDTWIAQSVELGRTHRWVQVFENKGAIMGCSNPHPHGQIWAGSALPNEPAKEHRRQQEYFAATGRPLLVDYLAQELASDRSRLVVENDGWVAVVPFWAVWPFETLLLPRRAVQRLPDLEEAERDSLADILKRLTTRYDNLFRTSFPYSMGWHGAPTGADLQELGDLSGWQLHAHFYPPLLRSAEVKKFMVGYEMMAEAQRDLTPEQAADRLRQQTEIHYRSGG